MYLLSHFDHEHKDDYTPPAPVNESNLASVDVPMGIPAATTRDPSVVLFEDDDPLEFQGAWCAAVSNTDADAAFRVITVLDDSDDDDDDSVLDSDDATVPIITMFPAVDSNFAADLVNGARFAADLASLAHLSAVEREMFLQVEHDMFSGVSSATFVKPGSPESPDHLEPHIHLDPVDLLMHFPTIDSSPFIQLG